jgi:hypothetical protein
MLTADVNINEFSRGLNRLSTDIGLSAKRVMKKEVGELIKTLVKLSPPKNLATSKKKSEKDVGAVYRKPPQDIFKGPQIGKKNTRWLYATPGALVGVDLPNWKPELNPTSAKRELYKAEKLKAWKRVGNRRNQSISILQRKVIKSATFNGVVSRIKASFGRLKAGWLAAVTKGDIQLAGGNKPPSWVTKHAAKARGDRLNQLETPNNPSFTIINRAVGIGSPRVAAIVSTALRIRAKAMKKNAELILSGKKEYTY